MNVKYLLLIALFSLKLNLLISQNLPENKSNEISIPLSGLNSMIPPSTFQDNYIIGWPWEWQIPVNTGSFSFVLIEDTANPRINQHILSDGDFIGAFYTGTDGKLHCAGAGEWLNQSLVFPIVGDDQYTPVKEGFSYNETIKFGFFDQSKNKTFFLPVGNFSYGACANCNTTGRYANTMIYRIVEMFYNYTFDVVAKAEPDSICEAGITQLTSIIDGTGGPFTYLWTSNPPGFSSNQPNPQFFINQTIDFIVSVIDETDTSAHHALVKVTPKPTVFAGEDQTICSGNIVALSAMVSNYNSLIWSTDGDGTFSSNSINNPTYSPGSNDIINGEVRVWITAAGIMPCSQDITDTVKLTILKSPTVNAGPDGIICGGDIIALNATAANYVSVTWTRNGSGTPGLFNDPNILNPIYTPSNYDISLGYVSFTVMVTPVNPCTATASDQITVNIIKVPISNAGTGGSICASEYFSTAATAYNYHHILWTSSGDGYFQNPGVLNTRYYPGQQDRLGRNIVLTLTAYPNSPCPTPATSTLNLFIRRSPAVTAPADGTACEGNPYNLSASAVSYTTISWTTTGNGSFSNSSSLVTQYIPSHNDAIAGSVRLIVSASGIYPCNYFVTDTVVLMVLSSPTSNAGNDQLFCDREPLSLTGTASNYYSTQWVTTGDGVFSNPNILNTLYTPGIADTTTGTCKIVLKSIGSSPCIIEITDTMLLTRVPTPQVNAGISSAIICQTGNYLCNGSVTDAADFSWETSGDGTFSDPNILNPIYYPGIDDIYTGMANLNLIATYFEPCNKAISDNLDLDIIPNPTVNAGPDGTVCEENFISLNATGANYSSIFWSRTGAGAAGNFNNPNILNPTYTLSESDIVAGFVTFILTLEPLSPCTTPAIDQITFNITKLPEVNAGIGSSICSSEYFSTNASALNFHHTVWTSSGDGYFQNPGSLNTNYYPGPQDQLGGNIMLSLTAFPNSPCSNTATSNLNLFITRSPEVTAPEDGTTCEGNPYNLTASAVSYSSISWTSTGSGSFSNSSSLVTQYIPSHIDAIAGNVRLIISASGIYPCNYFVTDTVVLMVLPSPTSNAGNDQFFCDREPLSLTGTASNYYSTQWVTTGDGEFSNPNSLNVVYTPGIADTTNGSCKIILVATGLTPCVLPIGDTLYLNRVPEPQVNLGASSSLICYNQTFQCSGSVSDASDFYWDTSGDGTFSNIDVLDPVYTPGNQDISTGLVTLRLIATYIYPCVNTISDQLELSILQNPVVGAGSDQTVCSVSLVDISGSVELRGNAIEQILWTTSGSGVFYPDNQLSTQYLPSSNDSINGTVTLSLDVQTIPCNGSFTDQVTLYFPSQLEINTDINDTTVVEGDDANFDFEVSGIGETFYFWFGPNGLIPDENTSHLTIFSVEESDTGSYYCIAGNECAIIQSSLAHLGVTLKLSLMLPTGWSGISTNLQPLESHIDSILQPIYNNFEVIKNLQTFYWPGENISGFDSWDTTSGYMIMLNYPQNFSILGERFSSSEIEINSGWNIIPVLSRCTNLTEAIFQGINEIEIVKDVAGEGVYWPNGGIFTLPTIDPGKAYFVYSSLATAISFPDCISEKIFFDYSFKNHELSAPWPKPEATTNTHIVGIDKEIVKLFNEGDLIGVFSEDSHCLGWVRIQNHAQNHALVIFGDELDNSLTKTLIYKYLDINTYSEYVIHPEFQVSYQSGITFTNHGLSYMTGVRIDIQDKPTISQYQVIEVFPNPAKDKITIRQLGDICADNIVIQIFSEQGILMKSINLYNTYRDQYEIDIRELEAGIYSLNIVSESSAFRKKLIVIN